jgi:hypothetical protein
MATPTTIHPRPAGVKAGGTVRGGGGICPAQSHAQYFNVNLAQAQDLARVAVGKVRHLTKIPEHSRLEATGLRVEGGWEGEDQQPQMKVRASIGTVNDGQKKPDLVHNIPLELEKRTKAEWNGLHVNVKDGQQLWVRVQRRPEDDTESSSSSGGTPWELVLEEIIDPLAAFTVKGQDVVWHPTKVVLQNTNKPLTVWTELSLMRLTSNIMDRIKAKGIAVKQRKVTKKKFDIRPKRYVCVSISSPCDFLCT